MLRLLRPPRPKNNKVCYVASSLLVHDSHADIACVI
jgi:hypothetical protein